MEAGELWFWIVMLAVGVIASYTSVPPLLESLQNQAPFEYNALGCPDKADLFARFPNRLQYRFAWFVLSGKAWAVTHGRARVDVVGAWLGYVLTAVAVLQVLLQGGFTPH